MAEQRRGEPESKSPGRGIRGLRRTGQKKAGWQFHMEKITIPMTKKQKAEADKGIKYSRAKKRTLRKAPKTEEKVRSPTDAEREAVGEGRAMYNKRGRRGLREESIGTKLRSFGRSLKRKITGRKASNRSSRKSSGR
jgi:hypothetical protein